MEIHRAKPQEAAILSEIALAAKRHWGYSERLIQGWKEALTIRPELIEKHETFVACLEQEAVGFYVLVAAGVKRISLEHLWVLPKAMGHGIGRALFTHAVQRAKALRFETIEIESDPNAEKFYERMGARRAGENVSEVNGEPRTLPVLIYDCS